MGMKKLMSLSSLLFSRSPPSPSSSSPCIWPLCTQPKTSSFRLMTSPLLPISTSPEQEPSPSFFFSSEQEVADKTSAEAVLDGVRSDRLFFDPSCCGDGENNSSVMAPGFGGGLAVEKESANPYRDFRASMEEMVGARGDRSWEWLQQMLVWFLRANGKGHHGLIVGAFFDLLLGFGSSSPSSSSPPDDQNPISSSSSSDSSFMFDVEGDAVHRNGNGKQFKYILDIVTTNVAELRSILRIRWCTEAPAATVRYDNFIPWGKHLYALHCYSRNC